MVGAGGKLLILSAAIIGTGIVVHQARKAMAEPIITGSIKINEFNVDLGEKTELSDHTKIQDIFTGGILDITASQITEQSPRLFVNIIEDGVLGKLTLLGKGEIFGLDSIQNKIDDLTVRVAFFRKIEVTVPSKITFNFTLELDGEIIATKSKSFRVRD